MFLCAEAYTHLRNPGKVQQSSVAEQLEDIYVRYASLYINTEVKRRDIYKMLDQLCQTAPLDHVFIALKQMLFMAQE